MRTITEAGAVAATAGIGWGAIEYAQASVGILIGVLSVGVLFYRFLIARREWRDGGKQKNNENLPDL